VKCAQGTVDVIMPSTMVPVNSVATSKISGSRSHAAAQTIIAVMPQPLNVSASIRTMTIVVTAAVVMNITTMIIVRMMLPVGQY